MADNELTLEHIHSFLIEKGGKVKNRDAVRYFKSYLTDPATKDTNRVKFKTFVNTLAYTKTEGDEKVLILKAKYVHSLGFLPVSQSFSPSPRSLSSPQNDLMNSLGIPVSPVSFQEDVHKTSLSPRQPPPYRPPPPVSFPSISLDNVSLGSMLFLNETPLAPPNKREFKRSKSVTSVNEDNEDGSSEDKQTVSVKERTRKFNRLASVDDELSPMQPKSAEKDRKLNRVDPKKCLEWYVTMSKGDYQELVKLANVEPRLVNVKDPFTAYNVLHWGAKYGKQEIVKTFAGRYKVDVNGKTNGGYTPLHISAQFGHRDLFKLLIQVYKADTNIRDYSGRTADYYFISKQSNDVGVTLRKVKGRKKQSEKDLGFLRIGSLNVRVKRTTEAFSNFLGVGSVTINPGESVGEKMHKGWGSADNVNKDITTGAPKSYGSKRKMKRMHESGGSSTPTTPKTSTRSFNSFNGLDSDSDTAAGFDSNWKN